MIARIKTQTSQGSIFWPRTDNQEMAKRASVIGARTLWIVGALSLMFGIYSTADSATFILKDLILMLLAVGSIGAAVFVYRLSRIAAILGLVLFVVHRIVFIVLDAGEDNVDYTGIIIALVIALLMLHGVRGTFAFHHHRHDQ